MLQDTPATLHILLYVLQIFRVFSAQRVHISGGERRAIGTMAVQFSIGSSARARKRTSGGEWTQTP